MVNFYFTHTHTYIYIYIYIYIYNDQTANTLLSILNTHFHNRLISKRFPARLAVGLCLATTLSWQLLSDYIYGSFSESCLWQWTANYHEFENWNTRRQKKKTLAQIFSGRQCKLHSAYTPCQWRGRRTYWAHFETTWRSPVDTVNTYTTTRNFRVTDCGSVS